MQENLDQLTTKCAAANSSCYGTNKTSKPFKANILNFLSSAVLHRFRRHLPRLIRHGLVSVLCGAIDFGVFSFLFNTTGNTIISQITSFLVATFIGYWAHTYYTFNLKRFSRTNLFLFKVQAIVVLVYGVCFMYVLVDVLLLNPYLSKILQLGTGFFINYSIGYLVSFRHNR